VKAEAVLSRGTLHLRSCFFWLRYEVELICELSPASEWMLQGQLANISIRKEGRVSRGRQFLFFIFNLRNVASETLIGILKMVEVRVSVGHLGRGVSRLFSLCTIDIFRGETPLLRHLPCRSGAHNS
jgi:hypothetical protein